MSNETNTQPLVTIPRNVADAIERMKSDGYGTFEIMQYASGNYHGRNYDADIVWSYVSEARSERLTVIMRALLDGFNVEATPQEKLREYYEATDTLSKVRSQNDVHMYKQGEVCGIRSTLTILGIKIEGVNA